MNRYMTGFRSVLTLAVALGAGGFASASFAHEESGSTITVNCPDSRFNSINAAIAAAGPGDTVLVCPGIYHENVVINKEGLKVVSKIKGAAKIQAGTCIPALSESPQCTITRQGNGVTFVANNAVLKGFEIEDFDNGIYVQDVGHERILDNTLIHNAEGISFHNSLRNVVEENTIVDSTRDGIIDFLDQRIGSDSANLYAENNIQYNETNGIFIISVLVVPDESAAVTRAIIKKNRIKNNDEDGVRLNDSAGVVVLGNDLSFNGTDGIELFGVSRYNLIRSNAANANGSNRAVCGASEGPGNCTGIRLHTDAIENKIIGNSAFRNLVWDIQDNSPPRDDNSTSNFYKNNRCEKDSPEGLCRE